MNKEKEEFYIGYLPKAPKQIANVIKITILLLGLFIVVMAFMLSKSQKGFVNSQFEFGKPTQVEGILHLKPVPFLRVVSGKDFEGNVHFQSILLVDFGKFGADSLIQQGELDNKWVKLEGALIYYDGVTMMELSTKQKAFIKSKEVPADLKKYDFNPSKNLGSMTIQGEIVDPKCYFGVMKPGYGKPHRSCAVRCISGGIPPALVSRQENENHYFILLGKNNQPINKDILKYVGDFVEINGRLSQFDNWTIIHVDPNTQITKLATGNILQ